MEGYEFCALDCVLNFGNGFSALELEAISKPVIARVYWEDGCICGLTKLQQKAIETDELKDRDSFTGSV